MLKRPTSGMTVFEQFGFIKQQDSSAHDIGRCPFCGSDGHFYINKTAANKTWDCKKGKCGRSGGYKTFIQDIVEYCRESFTKATAKKLVDSRGLSFDTFQEAFAGFHPLTGQYILPVLSITGKEVLNIKLYDFQTMRNTAGLSSAMYGLWDIPKEYTEVFICEGEWDRLAMKEIVNRLKLTKVWVTGAPGAGTFKTDSLHLYTNKNVFVFYDNDEAGKNGMDKVNKLMMSTARRVLNIRWPDGYPEGFDVRDLHKANGIQKAEETYTSLMSWMEDVEPDDVSGRPASVDIVDVGEPVDPAEVYKVFRKWLHLPDTTLIDVMYGTLLANRLSGDPLWMFIVAPPGATKTEPLLTLSRAPLIETISTLTPHVLISGANFGGGGDPSLIPKLDGKVLIIKDFTSVLGLPSTERDEIFSILRDAYDGECSKPFGNGVFRRYKSKFGILAAVTPSIELFTEDHAALGERFLRWRNWVPDNIALRRKYIEKALGNVSKEVEMRKELSEISEKVLKAKYTVMPSIPAQLSDAVISMAQLIAILRGTVVRDKYSREITHKSFVELGTRISKQLYKLLLGIGMFRQTEIAGNAEYKVVKEVGISSVPNRLLEPLRYIIKTDQEATHTPTSISKAIGLPYTTCTTIMDNMVMLGAMVKKHDELTAKSVWCLSKDVQQLVDKSKIFSKEV